ncbi:MAG: hypothetical protein FWG84_07390 [Bacteroidales bacterium]|nr:hypothetical protein [Bacteroidales bacterium]
MDEINRMYKEQEDPNSYLELKQGMLCDMFSSENKDYLFFPLYNHQGEQTSFILLSAGIDGKQNTFLRPTDTLYVDDWHEKLATYNYKEVEMEYHLEYPREYQFSMWDYWFGKKDYVVMLGYKCP